MVRDGLGVPVDDAEPGVFPAGAALRARSTGWVLLDEAPGRGLGRALAWAGQHGVTELHVLAEPPTDVLARRAALFRDPPRVWSVEGREVRPAVPAPRHEPVAPRAEALGLVDLLREAGVEIVVEHGRVTGEVLGLEIAQVVVDDGGARIEVGVGHHDREAFAMVHGDLPAAEALARVVDGVRRHRRPGARQHPLGGLVAERWLRAVLLDEPALAGAVELVPAEGTVARDSVKEVLPAIALGAAPDGAPLVVACSVGIDLDLVPAAADARHAHAPGARLVLVVPERDALPVTRRLAAALADPAEVRTVPDDWRAPAAGR